MKFKTSRNLAIFATAFAMVVVILGAFTRLADAGLGCPDWPGCYGFMHIPSADEHIQAANEAFPETPYEFEKAWPEMVHRYFAGTLGLIVLALAIMSWRSKPKLAIKQSTFLLVLICFQAALGMWTVTMKLHPVVVMAHLMGGITTFSLLASLAIRYQYAYQIPIMPNESTRLKKLAVFTLAILAIQVALGGWVSANYAALVCHDLPICQGDWFANADFYQGFHFWGKEADSYEFGILDQNARIAIHAAHRIGAIVASLTLIYFIIQLFRTAGSAILSKFAVGLSVLLIVQIVLGVNNVLMKLPLANAVAHNAVGALIVVALTCLMTLIVMSAKAPKEAV